MPYVRRSNGISFLLGDGRAYVNPPSEYPPSQEQWVYRADGAIRIVREALVGHYNFVLREVVRLSSLERAYVEEVLQEVVRQVHAQESRHQLGT